MAQWIPDDDMDVSMLENDLPLGALRKARKMSVEEEEGEEDSDDKESSEREVRRVDKVKDKKKRINKHAPMEVTSKRPVSRKRTVIESNTTSPRDPRFCSLSGSFSADHFQRTYGFIASARKTELSTLKENLKRARKMLRVSPSEMYAAREMEVDRLERAVKRVENEVHLDERNKIERDAMRRVREEEKERRSKGKREWYLKKSKEKEVRVRARYEALAKKGSTAVKKAIAKKQKKIGQREKRKLTFNVG